MSAADHEMVDEPLDSRAMGTGLPANGTMRRASRPDGYHGRDDREPRRPTLWGLHAVQHHPTPVWGMLPRGFLAWAHGVLGSPAHRRYLHVCSGGIPADAIGWRLDLQRRAAPDVLADGRALPFKDGCLDAVLIDPPYSKQYARDLYGVDYPRPSHLLAEAARVLRPGGAIGFVHWLVPTPPRSCAIELISAISQGPGFRVRAFTLMRKAAATMFDGDMLAPHPSGVTAAGGGA